LINEELTNDFIEETMMHIKTVEKKVLQLVENKKDSEAINEIFRAVHSIKGAAGFFKFDKIVEISHSMESLFVEIRNNTYSICEKDIDILLSANDYLKLLVENINNTENIDISEIIFSIQKIIIKDTLNINESEISINTDFNVNRIDSKRILFKIHDDIIVKAKKRGHWFYEIIININEDLVKNHQTIDDFMKILESIGEIIDSYTNTETYLRPSDEEEQRVHILISSVLEKSLMSLAINLQESKILDFCIDDYVQELEVNEQAELIAETELLTEVESVNEVKTVNEEKSVNRNYKEESIRVKVSLLNELLNLTGELVLGRNQLLRTMEKHKSDIQGMDRIIQNIDHVTSSLQGKIMQTRMQPLVNVFDKFPRIIRNLSKSLNKEINLEVQGGEVELDKSIIEVLVDPLVHLVRNAAAHGLETPKERKSAGKTVHGTIELNAYYKSGFVIIDVIDDGKGIDLEKVKSKALENEIISSTELEHMSEKEIMELILKPGFSTSENVTDISGRGVGMDVVKTNIKKMGGNIEIYSIKNKETNIRLIIPLTLAILSAIIVESSNQKFALPQVNIKEIVRIVPNDNNKKLEYINERLVLRLREKLLPIVNLSEILTNEWVDISNWEKIIRILIVKIGIKEFGIVVDEIYDGEEVLVKSLPKYIKDSECYSGVTILGDGKVAMILDINSIAQKAKLKLNNETIVDNNEEKHETIKQTFESNKIILFKCSEHETLAMEVSLVERVEEIQYNNIELVGNEEFVKIKEKIFKVIRPSNYISISKSKNLNKRQYIIILKGNKSVGILINKICDTTQIDVNTNLNVDSIKLKGISGSPVIDNKILLLLNITELLEMALGEKNKV
jgi:two-component system chemotaxis sensor kinase CheA